MIAPLHAIKSAYGGIIALNREVPLELVEHFADRDKLFVEVLIAPSFTDEALERLSRRKNCACWRPAVPMATLTSRLVPLTAVCSFSRGHRFRGSLDLYLPHDSQAHGQGDGRPPVRLARGEDR